MILIYKLTDVRFLKQAAMIEIGIIVLIIVLMFVVRALQTWRAERLRKHKLKLNLLIDQAILKEELVDVNQVPSDLRRMATLLPILEAYDHNFTDKVWKQSKEHLISTFLEMNVHRFLKSLLWQRRQEGLRLISLWPEKLFNAEEVLPHLDDKVYLVRVAAAVCLIKRGEIAGVEAVLNRMVKDPTLAQYPYRDYLIQGGKKVFDALEQIAKTSDRPEIIAASLDILSTRMNHDLLPLALENVDSKNAECRLSAVKVLETIGGHEVIDCIIARLRDEDVRVRRASAHALGTLHALEGIPELTLLLQDADLGTRVKAAYALREMGPEGHAVLFKQSFGQSAEAHATAEHILAIPEL